MPVPGGHIGGDPNLLMFGEKITPNQHAIAREYGLFDNIYCSGAISADGHHWLNEAFADDYAERAMNNYPRSYPCCGTDPLVYAGNPFLWQSAIDRATPSRTTASSARCRAWPHSDNEYNARFPVDAGSQPRRRAQRDDYADLQEGGRAPRRAHNDLVLQQSHLRHVARRLFAGDLRRRQ